MSKILTKREFLEVRPKGDYEKYLSYVARKRGERADRRETAWMAPLTDAQIRQRARADIMPVVRALMRDIESSIARRSRAGMGAVTGLSRDLARSLMPFYQSAGAVYDAAAGRQGALASALPAALVGQGRALGAEIGGKLGMIDAPARMVDEIAGGVVRTGEGAARAEGALGRAELGRLRTDQQAHRAFSAAFPGIAGMTGTRDARLLQLQLNRELADRLGSLTAQVPGQILDLVRSYRQEEVDKGIARATMVQKAREQQLKQTELASESKKLRLAPDSVSRSYGYIMGYDSQGNLRPLRGPDGKPIPFKEKPRATGTAKGEDRQRERADYFYKVREDVFERAREYAETTKTLDIKKRLAGGLVTKEEARRRLWAEFGTMLVGRGYPRKTVAQMIDRAVETAYGAAASETRIGK